MSADCLPDHAMANPEWEVMHRLAQILDLFWEESWRSVYAGELEVRPLNPPETHDAVRDLRSFVALVSELCDREREGL